MSDWQSALARTLVHSLWEGAAVAADLALVLLRVRSSRARYAASAVAMLAPMGGLVVTFTHFASKQPVSAGMNSVVATRVALPKLDDGPSALPAPDGRELYETLAKAGWVTADSGPDVLLTTSDATAPRKINLQQLQMGTDPTLNVTLTGGEVINVPDAMKELAARFPKGPKIWITGNVAQPLVYPIANPADATVLKAIASAGGVAEHHGKTAWIYRRDDTGNRREIQIPLSDIMHRKAQDVTLQADDVLWVPNDNGSKKMQEYCDTHPLTPPWEIAK